MTGKARLGILVALLVAVASAGGYVLGNHFASGGGAHAAPAVLQPAPTATGGAAAQIDTSQPGWDQKYLAGWRVKPRRDQVLNGISVGPTVTIQSTICTGERVAASAVAAEGTPMQITARYLPQAATINPDDSRSDSGSPALSCGGAVVANNARIDLPAALDAEARVASGESWFEVPHGGYILVSRARLGANDSPAMRTDVPADNWEVTEIAGHPAALGHPVLDGGLGVGEVVVWDETNHVLTLVHSYNVSVDELKSVTEGLFR